MLADDTLVGRVIPARRRGPLTSPARLLLARPYLLFIVRPTVPVAAVTAAVASAGYSATLMSQDRPNQQSPDDIRGHAPGLQSAGTTAARSRTWPGASAAARCSRRCSSW